MSTKFSFCRVVFFLSIFYLFSSSLLANPTQKVAYINVLSLGIKADGKTDNTEKLQSAINSICVSGKGLFFPKGIYLTRTLVLKSNVFIKGAGTALTQIKTIALPSGQYIVGNLLVAMDNVSNIKIEEMELNGGCNDYQQNESAILSFKNAYNIKLFKIKVRNGLSNGIAFLNCDTVLVDKSSFSSFGWCAIMAIGLKNAQFTNNQTSGWSLKNLDLNPAWGFPSLNSENVIVANNSFINTSKAIQFAIEMYGGWCINWKIANNIFDAKGYKGSGISGAFKHSTISNNRFLNGSGSWRCGLEVQLDSSVVANNIINNGSIALTPFTVVSHHFKNGKLLNNIINTTIENERCIQIGGGETEKDSISTLEIMENTINAQNAKTWELIYVGFYGRKCNVADVKIWNNFFYGNQTSTSIRIGGYSAKNIDIQNNTLQNSAWGIYVDDQTVVQNINVKLRKKDKGNNNFIPKGRAQLTIVE